MSRKRNPGWFRKGYDPRRHILTREERSRGGKTTFRKFLVLGRWHLDWFDRCLKSKGSAEPEPSTERSFQQVAS